MSKRTWKMEYWPEIVAILIDENEGSGNSIYPCVWDNNKRIRQYLGVTVTANSYFYINTPELMKVFLLNYETICALSHYIGRLKHTMRHHEKKYIHQIIYNKRKEEFDALVSKNDS